MKRGTKWALVALAAGLVTTSAVAGVAKGGKLFIKNSGVQMTEKADGGGKKTPLKLGDEVTWNGPDEKNKQVHSIEFKGKKGFVQMANLTPNKPADEIAGDGKATSAAAFASSGAATKAMSESGLKYAQGEGPNAQEVAAGLIHLEGSSEDQKSKVADHVKKQGLGGEK